MDFVDALRTSCLGCCGLHETRRSIGHVRRRAVEPPGRLEASPPVSRAGIAPTAADLLPQRRPRHGVSRPGPAAHPVVRSSWPHRRRSPCSASPSCASGAEGSCVRARRQCPPRGAPVGQFPACSSARCSGPGRRPHGGTDLAAPADGRSLGASTSRVVACLIIAVHRPRLPCSSSRSRPSSSTSPSAAASTTTTTASPVAPAMIPACDRARQRCSSGRMSARTASGCAPTRSWWSARTPRPVDTLFIGIRCATFEFVPIPTTTRCRRSGRRL